MSRAPAPLPAHLGSEFRCADAVALGVGKWRLRGADLERPFRGVRGIPVDAAQSSRGARSSIYRTAWEERQLALARAYALIMPPRQFFCGATAAVIWELPVPVSRGTRGASLLPALNRDLDDVDVGALAPSRAPRRRGISAQHFAPTLVNLASRRGLRVLDAPSLWATFGPLLELPDRVALADAIVRTPRIGGNQWAAARGAHATVDDLERAVMTRRRIGRELLLEALPLVRDGASSAPESHLRLALLDAGIEGAVLDYDVHSSTGRYLGTSEIAFPRHKLVVEYEGEHHRVTQRQWDRDIQKYQDYQDAGWEVIRVTSRMLYTRRHEVIATVRAALKRREGQH